jgi:hypothetical protein
MKRKSMSFLGCIAVYLLGLLTADLVKPMIEKIPVVGDLFGKADDVVAGMTPAESEGEA